MVWQVAKRRKGPFTQSEAKTTDILQQSYHMLSCSHTILRMITDLLSVVRKFILFTRCPVALASLLDQ